MSILVALERTLRSPAFKLVVVLAVMLALTIPLLFVFLLIKDRASTARVAVNEVGALWGGQQFVSGPYLVIPTESDVTVTNRQMSAGSVTENNRTETQRRYAVFLPERLDIKAEVATEERARGIFRVPVYRSQWTFQGRFAAPDLSAIVKTTDRVLWAEAAIVMLIGDVRGIRNAAILNLSALGERAFEPGAGRVGLGSNAFGAMHVPVREDTVASGADFSFDLVLNGSQSAQVSPAGGETRVAMTSDWPHPSFQGAFLPEGRQIDADGFSANWRITKLARGSGQIRHLTNLAQLSRAQAFGVRLHQPVWFYSLAERALKYALGFIGAIFFTVFILEMRSGQRVHWVQYLFVGTALLLFYVLLTGTAEHIGFDRGYALAGTATAVLVATYCGAVMASVGRGVMMFVILAAIYGLLYLLLRLEDYALLVGAVMSFALLAIIMFATRSIDWSGASSSRFSDTLEDDLSGPAAAAQR